jgi:hypothetical protein
MPLMAGLSVCLVCPSICLSQVCRTLSELNVRYVLEKFMEDENLLIDIVLEVPGHPKLAIDVDGPRRFSSNKCVPACAHGRCNGGNMSAHGPPFAVRTRMAWSAW